MHITGFVILCLLSRIVPFILIHGYLVSKCNTFDFFSFMGRIVLENDLQRM